MSFAAWLKVARVTDNPEGDFVGTPAATQPSRKTSPTSRPYAGICAAKVHAARR
jgi:hypothetical protein